MAANEPTANHPRSMYSHIVLVRDLQNLLVSSESCSIHHPADTVSSANNLLHQSRMNNQHSLVDLCGSPNRIRHMFVQAVLHGFI